jgi:hypothetical protein
VPITRKDADRASVMGAVDGLVAALKGAGIRTKVDCSCGPGLCWCPGAPASGVD